MAGTRVPYKQMLHNLALQITNGKEMLRKMGLYRAYASLRDFRNPFGSVEPQQVQTRARTTAEANALSISFWLTKSAGSGIEPRRVVEDTSRLVEGVINLAPQPRDYACRRGCHFCCYEAVTVSEVEAAALAQHVETLPEAEKTAVLARLESYAKELGMLGDQLIRVKKVPCPFLDTQNGDCTVYAIRPYMCRALTSYDVAPCQTVDQSYEIDHIRYNAYAAALIGAMHPDYPDHMSIIRLPPERRTREGENLAVGVLRQLSSRASAAKTQAPTA